MLKTAASGIALAIICASSPAIAARVKINASISMGSSVGTISDEKSEYTFGKNTKNIKKLVQSCPVAMAEKVTCEVIFDAKGTDVARIISARRLDSLKPLADTASGTASAPASPNLRNPAWQDAYSRRNYKLGMTLSEFRAARYPDQKEWPGASPVCAYDAKVSELPGSLSLEFSSYPFKNVGAIRCEFFYSGAMGIMSAGLMLGDTSPGHNIFMFYKPGGQNEPILYNIESEFPAAAFYSVVDSLKAYYGQPQFVGTENYTTGLGSQITGGKVIFANPASSIMITQYSSDLRRGAVSYVLSDVTNELIARAKGTTNRSGPP